MLQDLKFTRYKLTVLAFGHLSTVSAWCALDLFVMYKRDKKKIEQLRAQVEGYFTVLLNSGE